MSTRTMTKNELASELAGAIFRIAKSSKRSIRADLEALDLTVPQGMVLHTLAAAGGRLSARELGRECDMLASTATGVVDRLELHGLVERERDVDDRRVVWIKLTEQGTELQSRLPAFQSRVGEAFTVLTTRELEQLLDAVRRVEAAAEEGGR
jgi:MarR family transcriptional regulator, organic hydroperoxide resistance regulator